MENIPLFWQVVIYIFLVAAIIWGTVPLGNCQVCQKVIFRWEKKEKEVIKFSDGGEGITYLHEKCLQKGK